MWKVELALKLRLFVFGFCLRCGLSLEGRTRVEEDMVVGKRFSEKILLEKMEDLDMELERLGPRKLVMAWVVESVEQ